MKSARKMINYYLVVFCRKIFESKGFTCERETGIKCTYK